MALSEMQQLMIRDADGRCRCPYCGKFRKETDFLEQNGHVVLGNKADVQACLHVAPACFACMKED